MKQTQPSREQWREGILEMLKSAKSDEQEKLKKSSRVLKNSSEHGSALFVADSLVRLVWYLF